MADIANIDPDFEPQSRPRSCTWPMKRPNLGNQQDNENDIAMKLEPTIEEVDSQDQLMMDPVLNSDVSNIKQDPQDNLMLSSGFPTADFGRSPAVDCLSEYTASQPSSTVSTSDLNNDNLSFLKLESLPQSNSVSMSNYGALPMPGASQNITEKSNFLSETSACSIGHQLHSASSTGDSTVTTSPTVAKTKSSSRKNAWGNMSYADLITQGIESSPDKRLTLAQIYDWMVKNVSYFKDKGDSNSSAGWKNSIRHNLSLHAKFKRIQNEGSGKSSWWVINHDAKPGKPNRRRTTSLDTSNQKLKQSQRKALGKKSEMLKKQKSCTKRDSSQSWGKSGTGPDGLPDFDHHPLNKSLMSDYRPRTSSNASSIVGRISPPSSLLTQDLEDDGPPPLSPLSSSSFAAPTSNLDLFGRTDPFNNLVGDFESMQSTGELPESYSIDSTMTQSPSNQANIYLNSSQSGQSPFSRGSPVYGQQIGSTARPSSTQQLHGVVNSTTNSNKGVLSTPNLASLLQQGGGNQQIKFQTLTNKSASPSNRLSGVDTNHSVPRARANTMPKKLQPQPKYDISDSMRRQQSGESLTQGALNFSSYPASKSQQPLPASPESQYVQYQYGPPQQHNVQMQAPRQQAQEGLSTAANQNKTIFQLLGPPRNGTPNSGHPPQLSSQQGNSMTLQNQRMEGNIQLPNYSVQSQNGASEFVATPGNSKYLSDLNSIDSQDMFDPGTFDIEQMLEDIKSPENNSLGMEFNSYFPQENFSLVGMDNTIDSPLFSGGSNRSPAATFAHPDNRASVDSNYLQQQQQQQHYSQPFNTHNSVGANELMVGSNAPSSGSALISRPAPSGLVSHFNHGRQMIRAQSSMGTISDYRL